MTKALVRQPFTQVQNPELDKEKQKAPLPRRAQRVRRA